MHSFIQPVIHSFTHSSIHPFIQSIHSFIHSFIHPSIHPFIHSFIHPIIHPSIDWLIDWFIHSLFYAFTDIHPSIHPLRFNKDHIHSCTWHLTDQLTLNYQIYEVINLHSALPSRILATRNQCCTGCLYRMVVLTEDRSRRASRTVALQRISALVDGSQSCNLQNSTKYMKKVFNLTSALKRERSPYAIRATRSSKCCSFRVFSPGLGGVDGGEIPGEQSRTVLHCRGGRLGRW